jgi:hypothetical protein
LRAHHDTVYDAVDNVDPRAVLVCNLLDDGQTQPRALGFGRDVGLKGAFEDVVRKSAATIQTLIRTRPTPG